MFALTCLVSSASDWELEKDKDGIRVYTRSPGDSDVKEFKVYADINADRIEILKILTRAGDYMNWMPNVDESRVLEVVSDTKRIVYYKVDCPWPTSNRDLVLDFWVENDEEQEATYIRLKENNSAKKEVSDCVRMKKAHGYWKLTTIAKNKTKVYYQFLGDPGGSLPSWLVNMFIVDGPFDTFVALKKKVE